MTDAPPSIRPLTSVRGVAALWVFVYHARSLHAAGLARATAELGYLGVDVFFILSGFIITYVYLDDFSSWQDVKKNTRRFLGLRFWRIYPLHLITLLLWLAYPIKNVYEAQNPTVSDFVQNLLLVHSWGFPVEMHWNIPSWSISVEWLLYLCFPLMAWGIGKRRDPLFNVLLLALALWTWVMYLYAIDMDMSHFAGAGLSVLRGILDFTMGITLHNLFRAGFLRRLPWDALSVAGILGLVGIIWLQSLGIIVHTALILALFAFMIYALANVRSWGHLLFSNRVMVYLGTISYSLYLFHWQYLQFTWMHRDVLFNEAALVSPQFAAKMLGLVAVAALSYHLIENPIRKWGQKLAKHPS